MDEPRTPHRRRWFQNRQNWVRFTLVALLPVEGFILLSLPEEFGGTVGIALAAVTILTLVMLFWLVARSAFRRRFQYSLRTLLLVMTLACIGMSLVGTRLQKAWRQKQVVNEIKKLGGLVEYKVRIGGPLWLRSLRTEDFFTDVFFVAFSSVSDADLEHLERLPQLTQVNLQGSKVTDVGMEHLKGLTQLQDLNLSGTQVTDTGLGCLKGLKQLRDLNLSGTQVTDTGLGCLKGLTQLWVLDLSGTHITDVGLEHLNDLIQLRRLDITGTQVTDAGLERLEKLYELQHLCLAGTQVTDALEHIEGLAQLDTLDIRRTQITEKGVKKLQQAMPNCIIINSFSGRTNPLRRIMRRQIPQ